MVSNEACMIASSKKYLTTTAQYKTNPAYDDSLINICNSNKNDMSSCPRILNQLKKNFFKLSLTDCFKPLYITLPLWTRGHVTTLP